MGTVIEFKRPEKPVSAPAKKVLIAGALSPEGFDYITRHMIDPDMSYEDRVELINRWRAEWKAEPLEVRCDRR